MEVYWVLIATFLFTALSTIPLAIDMIKIFFPHRKIFRIAGRMAHIYLFINVSALFLIIIRYHHFVYLPLILKYQSPLESTEGLFHVLFSTWLWINTLGNYFHTISIYPGRDASYRSRRVRFEEQKLASYGIKVEQIPAVVDTEQELSSNETEIPIKSGIYKESIKLQSGAEWNPKRTQFCSICRYPVSYWDHHCPFTGNCIGLRNYSNFFIGLFYGVIGGIYAVSITWPFFYSCKVKQMMDRDSLLLSFEQKKMCNILGLNSYVFLPTFLGLCLSSGSMLLHVILLLADLSTYDIINRKNWDRYPMVLFIWQRICARKFLDHNSRLKVLLLKRKNLLSYLIPTRNTRLSV